MHTYLISFVAATIASALFTPLARAIAFKFNIVSVPGGRHIHGRSIPRMGGLGIFLGAVSPFTALYFTGSIREVLNDTEEMRALGLLFGGAVMFAVGLLDDVKGVRALHKLSAQIVAAVIAWKFGFRIDTVGLPFLGEFNFGVLSLPATVLWIVGIINAVNLIDGLDGLAAGVVFFAGVTNFVVAYLTGTVFIAVVMAVLAGAVLGFLFFNFNPARIFMGDSGSYFLGYILAACSIAGPLQKASATISIVVPLVALGVPIIDTLLAIVRRFLERRPLFSPDRGHIHHRLLDMGITHRRAVLIIYGVSIALCVGAIGIAFGRSWEVGAAILGVSAVLFGLIRFIGYFEYLMVIGRQKQRIRSRHVEWLRKVVLQLGPRLNSTPTEEAALAELKWLAEHARFDFIELLGPKDEVLKAWAGADYTDMDRRDMCTARFPVANNGFTLKFGWRSEYGDVPPQMDILLQLVVDQVQAALEVHQSAMTRQPAEAVADAVAATTPARAH